MTLDPATPRSRRAILAAAAGAAAATVAAAVAKPSAVRAAGDDGANVVVGGTYGDVRSQTTLGNKDNDGIVLWVASNQDLGHGAGTAMVGYSQYSVGVAGWSGIQPFPSGISYGVHGASNTGTGVYGSSNSSYGVHGISGSYFGMYGESSTYIGVYGLSAAHNGVVGYSGSTSLAGTVGWSNGNSTGVQGVSGVSGPPAKANTGVYGYAAQNASARGVLGETTSGHAVHGTATSGYAGYFDGKVYTSKFHEMKEISVPSAPTANKARLFVRDNGSGKTQLCVRFSTGGVLVIKTQP